MANQEDSNEEQEHSFAIRLRFRSTKGLAGDQDLLRLTIDEREVSLLREGEGKLKEPGWFLARASGFKTPDDAKSFGKRLATTLEVCSVRHLWGVDVGSDRVTSAFGQEIIANLASQGINLRPNVHGLDVYRDIPGTAWSNLSATGYVSLQATPVVDDIHRLFPAAPLELPDQFFAIKLLNEAMLSIEAPAQIVLAIAAVESLVPKEDWSPSQLEHIQRLVACTEQQDGLPTIEKDEISEALRRMFRLGVRQGMKRLIMSLGLNDLWRQWDSLYAQRSTILHGLAYVPAEERRATAAPVVAMSARIVLAALDQHFAGSGDGAAELLPIV